MPNDNTEYLFEIRKIFLGEVNRVSVQHVVLKVLKIELAHTNTLFSKGVRP